MNRLLVPRVLAAGYLVSSATAVRVGLGCFGLWVKRTPPLVGLAVSASVGGTDVGKAQAEFRDDAIALARESAELSWRELRRAIDDFDAFTRPREAAGTRPHRPYRAKL